jgi:hypothetical protein
MKGRISSLAATRGLLQGESLFQRGHLLEWGGRFVGTAFLGGFKELGHELCPPSAHLL